MSVILVASEEFANIRAPKKIIVLKLKSGLSIKTIDFLNVLCATIHPKLQLRPVKIQAIQARRKYAVSRFFTGTKGIIVVHYPPTSQA